VSLAPRIEPEGVLLVDKPSGPTSHDVVARVRRKLQTKRVGHAGTLDPMASGLLVVLVGKATRASHYLMSSDKVYEGTLKLGEITNSQDAEGEVVESRPVPALSEDPLRETMRNFLGDQYQVPPMFSAIKVGGTPLYKLARKGEEIVREPRFIRVSRFELLEFVSPLVRFRLGCTKGTYVRTIAHDFGQRLGCGAHLVQLRRTASGLLDVTEAIALDTFEQLALPDALRRLRPVHELAPPHLL
jgi:tRNA pseudouridine55 synthase